MFKKGNLVKLVKLASELENKDQDQYLNDFVGIILDIATWPNHDQEGNVTDLFVCWSNGEKYWCSDTAVIVISD